MALRYGRYIQRNGKEGHMGETVMLSRKGVGPNSKERRKVVMKRGGT